MFKRLGLLVLALATLPMVAIAGVSDEEWKTAEKAFKSEYSRGDKAQACRDLGDVDDVRAVKLLWKVLTRYRPDDDTKSAIRQALAKASDSESIDFLAETVTGKMKDEERVILCRVLAEINNPKVGKALVGLVDDKDPIVRASALNAIAALGEKSAVPGVIRALDAKEWQVRAAAIECCVKLMDDRTVIPLIDRMDQEKGRLEGDIIKALRSMTGEKKETSLEWKAWWNQNKSSGLNGGGWDAWTDQEETGSTAKAGDDGGGSVATYYGIKIYSKKMVFVIDMSGSMDNKWEGKKPVQRRQTVTLTGEGSGKKGKPRKATLDWGKIKTKWDLAREQLIFTLRQLPPSAEFTIIYYHEKVKVWKPKLVKADSSAVNAAISHLRKIKPQKATNIYGALKKAFQIGGNVADQAPVELSGGGSFKKGGDTIFFLTDGWPTAGKIYWKKPGARKEKEEDEWLVPMMEAVHKWNAVRKIKVHTVGIGEHCEALMEQLASEFGGDYIVPGEDDDE